MIRRTTKSEVKRIRSLRKAGARNVPPGLYFIAPDNKAYIASDLKEMTAYIKQVKDELTSQLELI